MVIATVVGTGVGAGDGTAESEGAGVGWKVSEGALVEGAAVGRKVAEGAGGRKEAAWPSKDYREADAEVREVGRTGVG